MFRNVLVGMDGSASATQALAQAIAVDRVAGRDARENLAAHRELADELGKARLVEL